jgi:hypothetical protein
LLHRDRAVILRHLPAHADYFWVTVEATNLARLYVISCREWYLDTGGGVRLVDTATNLSGGRLFRFGAQMQEIDHLTAVEALSPKLADYDATKTDDVLILIAADKAGPYTIIDGTH